MKHRFILLIGFTSLLMLWHCEEDKTAQDTEIQRLEKATIFSYDQNKNAIVLNGAINTKAYTDFKTISTKHPTVRWIYIQKCEGSINDDVNLKLATYIHQQGFHTRLLENGEVASGGTDFFLAGNYRVLEKNTRLGVHSWSGAGKVATDFPKGHQNHQPYINYYIKIGMSQKQAEDFYYFTIHAAPASGIHWMTSSELKKYNFEKLPQVQ